jgi:hypothetical protein
MEAVVELEMGAIGDQQTPVDVIERLANAQSVDAAKECLTALSSFLDDPELVKQGGIQQAAVIRAANAAKNTIGEGWAESVDEYRALLYKFAESADEGIVEPPSEEAIRREEHREEPRAVAPKSGNKAMKGAGKRPGSCCLRCCTNCLFLVVLIASILWGVQLTGLIMPSKFGFPASPPSGCLAVPSSDGIQTGAQTNLFCAGDDGYGCYKIPSLLSLPPGAHSKGGAVPEGILLAFVEARKYSCADEGFVDIRLKRSLDHGKTWGQSQLVATMSTEDEWVTVGDPCPVYDQSSGSVHVVFTVNNLDVFVTKSSDTVRR